MFQFGSSPAESDPDGFTFGTPAEPPSREGSGDAALFGPLEVDDIRAALVGRVPLIGRATLRASCRFLQQCVASQAWASLILAGGIEVDLDRGGTGSSGPAAQLCDAVHALSPASMQWYALPRLTCARAEAAMCWAGDGRAVVAGGISELNSNARANLSQFVDVDTTMRGQPEFERGEYDFRGRISQCGAITGSAEMFSTRANCWTELPVLPMPVSGARAWWCASRSEVWIIGGTLTEFSAEDEQVEQFSSQVQVLDLKSNTWQASPAVPSMHRPRTEFGLSSTPAGIFVAGGTNEYCTGRPLTAELFDLKTGVWVELARDPRLGGERIGCSCAVLGDKVYVCGGMAVEEDAAHRLGASGRFIMDDYDNPTETGTSDLLWEPNSDEEYDGCDQPPRVARVNKLAVFSLSSQQWLCHEPVFPSAKTHGCAANIGGPTIALLGGSAEFYNNPGIYPTHSTTGDFQAIDIDSETDKLGTCRCDVTPFRVAGAAACPVLSDHLEAAARRHGWTTPKLSLRDRVELHSMKNASYNGRQGIIKREPGNCRWGVELLPELKLISVKAENLLLLCPSDVVNGLEEEFYDAVGLDEAPDIADEEILYHGPTHHDFSIWAQHRPPYVHQPHDPRDYPDRGRRSAIEAENVHCRPGAAMRCGHALLEARGCALLDYVKRVSDHNFAMYGTVVCGDSLKLSYTTRVNSAHWMPRRGLEAELGRGPDSEVVDLVHIDWIDPRNGRDILPAQQLDTCINSSSACNISAAFFHASNSVTARHLKLVGKNFTALRVLAVTECVQLDDAAVKHLKSLRTLRGLRLTACAITDRTVQQLSQMELEWLDLSLNARLTDGALQHLSSGNTSGSLKVLCIEGSHTSFSRAGMIKLSGCQALKVLISERKSIGVATIAHLLKAGCPLKHTMANADVSRAAVSILESQPNVAQCVKSWCFTSSPDLPPTSAYIPRIVSHYHWLTEIDLGQGCIESASLRLLANSPIRRTLRRLSLPFCEGVGNPESLMQISRFEGLVDLDLNGCLGYGPCEGGDPGDKPGNTKALITISQKCSKLHTLDLSFSEESLEVMATIVSNLSELRTFILKACYDGVEYPNVLQQAVIARGGTLCSDFEIVWDRN